MIKLKARAILRVVHKKPYDYDKSKGLWLYKKESEEEIGNLITDAGRVAVHALIYGTATQKSDASIGVGLNYVGLSNNGSTPLAGDTSLASELASDGLERVQGTVTLPTGSGTITTIVNEFTYTGGPDQAVQKTALFDAVTGGNMAHEILFTQRTMGTNDVISLTFSITVS